MSHTSDVSSSCVDSAAPLGSARQTPAMFLNRRARRRGPRTQLTLLRRSLPKHRRTLPGMCLGESRHLMPESISCTEPAVAEHTCNVDRDYVSK